MKKSQQGFAPLEILLVIFCLFVFSFAGWYVFVRPSMESRSQLTKVINAIILPPSYKPTKTTFSEDHPDFTTSFSISRDYEITTSTTRTEALQQIVKSLGLSPADHRTVDIYDEQLYGVSSPLFPFPGNGSSYYFSAKLEPSYSGTPFMKQCAAAGTDTDYRACINNDPIWGKNSIVKTVEIIVDKEPN